jgi:hypothetical protein
MVEEKVGGLPHALERLKLPALEGWNPHGDAATEIAQASVVR